MLPQNREKQNIPTDFTEFTEVFIEKKLPQISRIFTEVLIEKTPTDFTDLHRCIGWYGIPAILTLQ